MKTIVAYCLGVIKGAVLTIIVAHSIFFGYDEQIIMDDRFETYQICEGFAKDVGRED